MLQLHIGFFHFPDLLFFIIYRLDVRMRGHDKCEETENETA